MSKVWDLVIVGAGPAALTAALYAAREKLQTVVYEKQSFGGKIASVSHVDNYPGVGVQVTGEKLAGDLQAQAEHFGASMEYGEVEKICPLGRPEPTAESDGLKRLVIDGEDVLARAVLVATGCANRKLGVIGEEYSGIHYCATCDGALYEGKELIVVGGGNSAVQEALYLTKIAKHITLISATELTASAVLVAKLQELEGTGKVKVETEANITAVLGDGGKATGVKLADGREISADGIFVFIGHVPSVEFLGETKVGFDERGFIKTNQGMETDEAGIFAAGDVRSGSAKQMIVAAGEGATAAMAIGEYLR